MAGSAQGKPFIVKSVAKALAIVGLLAEKQRDMSLAEIAAEFQLPKSTVYGLLATMKEAGYIHQSAVSDNYRLGVRFFEIGNIVANNWDVRRAAEPFIRQLVNQIEETVHLAVLVDGEVLYIDKRESNQSIRIVSQVGARLPAHCTGVGKVLLAYLEPEEVERIIHAKGLKAYTRNTITDVHQLKAELERIRQQGYAIDNEEIMPSLYCIAAPIRDLRGKVTAGLSISGPVNRITGEKFEKIRDSVVQTAEKISRELGYRGWASK